LKVLHIGAEIFPLVNELNQLLAHSEEQAEEARRHAGNLAHALKTPLTVITNAATAHSPDLADTVCREATTLQSCSAFRNFTANMSGGDEPQQRAWHGLVRSLVANSVEGVTKGFVRELEIVGVGYKAEVKGKTVVFALGYSHPINFPIPEGIAVALDAKAGKLTISGADRQKVGQTAAEIRKLRVPDPYKGKGIKYANEVIRRKVGKAGGK